MHGNIFAGKLSKFAQPGCVNISAKIYTNKAKGRNEKTLAAKYQSESSYYPESHSINFQYIDFLPSISILP